MQIGVAVPPIGQAEFSVLAADSVLAEGRPILGSFVGVRFTRNHQEALLLGTVVDFQVVNDLSEYLAIVKNLQSVMANDQVQRILKRKSGLILQCQVISAFDAKRQARIPYDTPIHPFAPCELIPQDWILNLLKRAQDHRFFHVGRYYGSGLLHPLHLADFSKLEEAYHFVLAGLSGSGKSTLAKLLLAGYAQNPEMGFFILDTAGEFARAFRDQDKSRFPLPMASLWKQMGRGTPWVLGLDGLSLNSWELLQELLIEEKVFKKIRIKHTDNQQLAAQYLVESLKKAKVPLNNLDGHLDKVKNILQSEGFLKAAYSGEKRREEVVEAVEGHEWEEFRQRFEEVASHFKGGRPTPGWLIQKLRDNPGQTIVMDLSALGWEKPLKYLLIREVVRNLYRISMERYRQTGKAAFNTLVVVEEAHRLVPPRSWVDENNKELKETRETLLRALAETRKAGLGWMFISTRLGNLDRAVFEEARVKIIGRGLSTGEDADRIREAFGRDVLTYYAGLPDPTDPLMERRQHVFLVSGPICVLSRRSPEFVEVFATPEEFLGANIMTGGDDGAFS